MDGILAPISTMKGAFFTPRLRIAGLLAASGATITGYVLADRVFQIPFGWNPWVWLIGILGGAVGVALAGWAGTRGTLRQPPLAVLRQLG